MDLFLPALSSLSVSMDCLLLLMAPKTRSGRNVFLNRNNIIAIVVLLKRINLRFPLALLATERMVKHEKKDPPSNLFISPDRLSFEIHWRCPADIRGFLGLFCSFSCTPLISYHGINEKRQRNSPPPEKKTVSIESWVANEIFDGVLRITAEKTSNKCVHIDCVCRLCFEHFFYCSFDDTLLDICGAGHFLFLDAPSWPENLFVPDFERFFCVCTRN